MSILREEFKQLKTGRTELRKFGFLVGSVFLALGLWFLLRHKPWHGWFWGLGAALVVPAALAPQALKPVFVAWMGLALVLGLVVSTILLTFFFYLVITPIGLIARLAGRDFLERKWSNASSYWLIREQGPPKSPREMEQQF